MPYCKICKKNVNLGLHAHYYLIHDLPYQVDKSQTTLKEEGERVKN